ncbi:MAG: TIR domain-containing protein [Mycobacterium sp.]
MANDAFLSYSRQESKEFVARLAAALEARGRDCWVDLEDIPPASEFMQDLRDGIGGSDAFCFVLSPRALESEYCRRELDYALERNKRMIPIAHRRLAETPPEPLASHSWIPQEGLFDDDFDASVDELIRALDTDVDWVRGHTKWGQRAEGWRRGGQDRGALLRGQELRDAETWLSGQAGKTPAPTASHAEFVLRSQRESRNRTRKMLSAVAVALVISLVLAGVAFWQRSVAIANFHQATGVRLVSEAQAMLADSRTGGDSRALQELVIAAALTGKPDRDAVYDAAVQQHALRKIANAAGFVYRPAYSPDGTLIATGTEGGAIRLWDAATGTPHGEPLTGHQDNTAFVSFNSDGTQLVSASTDHTIRRWDVASGDQIGKTFNLDEPATWVTFGDQDKKLAVVVGHRLHILDAASGKVLATHPEPVDKVALGSNKADRLAVARGKTVHISKISTGAQVGPPSEAHTDIVASLAFTPDGARLVSGSHDKTLRVWDSATGLPIGEPLTGHQAEVTLVEVSPDGTLIASGSLDHTVRLWDVATGHPVGAPIPASDGLLTGLAFSPDGRSLAVGSTDSTLRIFDVGAARTVTGTAVAYGPDGAIVTGDSAGAVRRWDPVTHEPLGPPVTGHAKGIARLVASRNGQALISSGDEGTVRLWDPRSGRPVGEPIRVSDSGVISLALDPQGRRFATGSLDGTAQIWDIETRKPLTGPLRSTKVTAGTAMAVFLGSDGTRVASLTVNPTRGANLTIWDDDSDEPVYSDDMGVAFTGAFGSDTTMVLGGLEGTVAFVDFTAQEPLQHKAVGHTDAVMTAVYSPQGNRVATGSRNNDVRLWDAGAGTAIGRPITGPRASVINSVFSGDGTQMAIGTADNEVWVWPAVASPADLCAKLTENMSHEQWDEWVSPDIDYIEGCPGLPIAGT